MKNTLIGLALAGALASSALAGTPGDPVLENDLIATEAAASSDASAVFVLTLLTIAIVAAVTD